MSDLNRNVQSDKKLKILRLSNIKKLKKKKIDAISEVDSEEMVFHNFQLDSSRVYVLLFSCI